MLDAFLEKIWSRGLELYPAQEEAILEIMAGHHVILNTPTGSGKSLVATAMHFKALEEGKRSFYTCPIKALVSEKFFAFCEEFGPQNVGMMTGDASVNQDAPIVCCTAEVLSNLSLRLSPRPTSRGPDWIPGQAGNDRMQARDDTSVGSNNIDYVVMDEFHYYSDPERGIAWQIPLLTLSKTTFLLMSATLGDVEFLRKSLEELTGRKAAVVSSAQRPVPLDFNYSETQIHEALANLISERKYPVYVVNFTQREAVEQAQNAMSVNISTPEEKKKILSYFEGFRFDTPFGKDMKRYLSHGVGLHHAGILPKYRLLVEKLAQTGLLKIIMGTDTLGVGVNIPIRTVLFTKLSKFDGYKTGILSVRDFKQIAGRAGRKGFDDEGSVVCQAPEHVIENKRQESRYGADPKLRKKMVKKAPPPNFVGWDQKTFQRLIDSAPETLVSQFQVSHGMIMTLLQTSPGNANTPYRKLIELIAKSYETPRAKSKHRKKAAQLLKSLLHADLISKVKNRTTGTRLLVNETLQDDFSLHHALSLYLIHALSLLDREDPEYALNVLTLVESIIENPKVILMRQVDKLKNARMAEMRAQGLEYEERMTELEKVEHPKPLREFVYQSFNEFADKHPWVEGDNIQPKSIARDMFERFCSFNEYIKEYGLERSEGVLLRYLSLTYKTLQQSVPEAYKTEPVLEIEAYFKTLIARTDSSLIQEWEQMLLPRELGEIELKRPEWIFDEKAFLIEVRTVMQRLVKALAVQDYEEANAIAEFDYENALKDAQVLWNHEARSAKHTRIQKESELHYRVIQVLCDPEGNNEGFIECTAQAETGKLEPEMSIVRVELG